MRNDSVVHNYTGLSLLITSIALLAYQYASFMGLNYMIEGYEIGRILTVPHFIVSLAAIIVLSIVLCCSIKALCFNKKQRDKRRGLPREIFSAIVIAAILLGESIFFVKFLNIFDSREELTSQMNEMRDAIKTIDEEYNDYVNQRLADYDAYAKSAYKHRKHDFSEIVRRSLERRLRPEAHDTIATERVVWLAGLHDVSIWNVMTPQNVRSIIDASQEWDKQYAAVSSIIYEHEQRADGMPYAPFSSKISANAAAEWKQRFEAVDMPDYRTITALVLTLLLILTVYLTIKRPKNVEVGTHGR